MLLFKDLYLLWLTCLLHIFNHFLLTFKQINLIMKQHFFSKMLMLLLLFGCSVSDSWAQGEKAKGKFIENVYVVENRLIDTSQIEPLQRLQYRQQLKSLRRNSKKRTTPPILTMPDLPSEISWGGKNYQYINGDFYELKGKSVDYWVAQFGSNILEYRQNHNQINPERPKKLEFYNKSGKLFKTIYHDKINPYIKYKNLNWGGIDYADTHHGFANQKPTEADNYIFNSTTKYSNGYLLLFFELFSLKSNLVIKAETTIFVLDTEGNIYKKMMLPHITERPEISEDGKFLSFAYSSNTDNPLDFNKNGCVKIYDLILNKIFYEEYGTNEYVLSGIYLDENTGLYEIGINLKKSTRDRIFKFVDIEDNIIFSKYFTKEELEQKTGQSVYALSEYLQYDLFNQQKIK